jgi:hypothetical protein
MRADATYCFHKATLDLDAAIHYSRLVMQADGGMVLFGNNSAIHET